jgi:hypothetical protein
MTSSISVLTPVRHVNIEIQAVLVLVHEVSLQPQELRSPLRRHRRHIWELLGAHRSELGGVARLVEFEVGGAARRHEAQLADRRGGVGDALVLLHRGQVAVGAEGDDVAAEGALLQRHRRSVRLDVGGGVVRLAPAQRHDNGKGGGDVRHRGQSPRPI